MIAMPDDAAPVRSEAFAEDLFDAEVAGLQPAPVRGWRWLVFMAPLALLIVGVAAAVAVPLWG